MTVDRKVALSKAFNRLLGQVNGNKMVISANKLAREAFPDSRSNIHGRRCPYPEDVFDASIFLRSFVPGNETFAAEKIIHLNTNYRIEVWRKNHDNQ